MRKIILLLLFIVHFTLIAQIIIPIPADSTSAWRIVRGYTYGGPCADIYNSTYYVDGTITHNDKEYFLIYESGEFHQEIAHPPGTCNDSYTYEGIYRGAIRTENGKTYRLNNNNSESLLLDFTLNVGDTLYSSISNGLVIESIDYVNIGYEKRRRFNFTVENICGWMIEGIGHELGLFETMYERVDFASYFVCYGENGIPLFGNMYCEMYVGNDEAESLIHNLKIFPNPTFDELTVVIAESTEMIKSYRLIDVYGNVICDKKINQNDNKDFIVDLRDLKSGIYILSLNFDNNWCLFRKVIKR